VDVKTILFNLEKKLDPLGPITHNIFAHNIEIKRYCNKKVKRHVSSNIFFPM